MILRRWGDMSIDARRKLSSSRPAGTQRGGLAAALAVAAGLAATPVLAQQLQSQPFKAWNLVCNTTTPRQCYINQQVPPGGSKAIELGLTLFLNGAQQQPVLRIRLPLAAQAGKEVAVSIDQNPAVKAPIAGCNQDRCVVQGGLDGGTIQQLRAGRMINVTYLGAGAKPVTVHASLSGFSAAFDALKKS
jgi:invasion protein IalB